MEEYNETLGAMKETLIFLVEQEKVRAEEIKALNEKIEALNDLVTKQIVEPAINYYKEEEFGKFRDQYGERLGKYDDLMRSTLNEPEYDATREAWNSLEEMPPEEREQLDMETYVNGVETGIADYVKGIKEKLGLPEEAEIEIKEEDGETTVKADVDGDGEKEEVATESEEEETAKETVTDSDVDPELAKELEEYASK